MNILEHILADHYPKDEKGRALVPVSGNWTAIICATDGPRQEEIIGYGPASVLSWDPDGVPGRGEAQFDTLLPPQPRKVKVTACAAFSKGGELRYLETAPLDPKLYPNWAIVELTGEYEEPWA